MAIGFNSSAKTLGIGGRIIGSLFFGVFFLMGLGFEVMIIRQTAGTFATYNWTPADAIILSSKISPPRDSEHNPVLQVRYAYTFDGMRQESDGIETGSGALETSDVYQLAEHYAVGKNVPCWVNPAKPDEAVLRRKSRATGFIVLFPLIFVAVGGIGIWAMWRRRTPQDDDAAKPISSRDKDSKPGRLIMGAFFGVFLLAGCGAAYALFVGPVLQIFAARNWTQVPCEIVSSRVKTNSDSDGNTYSVDIVYRYTYHDRTYTSNQYHFMTGSSSGYRGKAEVVNRLPLGSQTTCYIDPANPADAVLERDANGELWFGLIPLVFVAVGAGGLIFTFRKKAGDSGGFIVPKPALATTGGTASRPLASGVADQGPQTLKPSASPKAKMLGVILAALFWNGIVSIFIFSVGAGKWDGFSWFMGLFLIPFILVGLGLIGAVFYQLMALFNPRPRLTVSRGVLLPGDTIDVSWELQGRIDRLQGLQIALEGREEATYGRGTNTSTDKEVFALIQIVDTADPVAMHSGSAKLHVPPGAMHSFKAANNKIVWALKVHGEIPRWPDIKDEYPVEVSPKPIAR